MSKEFWIAVVDVVVGLLVYFLTKYLAPELADDALFVIGMLQPLVLALIAYFFADRLAERIAARLK